jgi:hypothetical protein
MDLSTLLPQLGISAIFVYSSYKLYNDSREDSKRREEQIKEDNKLREQQMRLDSKEREEKLMQHLEKVVDTLDNINDRLCTVEKCVVKEVLHDNSKIVS